MLAFGIKQTSTTTGTGNLTLASVSGFPQFNDCFVYTNARRFEYEILDSNGAPVENGVGYLSAANTLVREKIVATYDSGVYDDTAPAAVSLPAGTKTVICGKGMATGHIGAANIDSASTGSPRRAAFDPFINFTTLSSSGFTMVANRLHLHPFYLAEAIECSGMQVRVGTGVASSSLRLGLYALGSNGSPQTLLGETSALASATSSVDVSGSFAASIRLSPGWYCCGIVSDAAIVIGTANSTCGASYLGGDPGNLILAWNYRYLAHTFGALPNPPSNATTGVSGAAARVIFCLTAV